MVKRKRLRSRGKLQFSRYFQKLAKDDLVAFVREKSVNSPIAGRMQGRTGIIEGKQGKTYIVKIKDNKKEKRFLIEPIHLKKIEKINKVKEKGK